MRRIVIAFSLAASLAGSPAPFLDFLSSLWSESGCRLDPDGCPAPRADEGCRLDPNGGCLPQRDEGCRLDPDGRCSS
jgi:hypothetical protein